MQQSCENRQICSYCKLNAQSVNCCNCKLPLYCSVKCQDLDETNHKHRCKTIVHDEKYVQYMVKLNKNEVLMGLLGAIVHNCESNSILCSISDDYTFTIDKYIVKPELQKEDMFTIMFNYGPHAIAAFMYKEHCKELHQEYSHIDFEYPSKLQIVNDCTLLNGCEVTV